MKRLFFVLQSDKQLYRQVNVLKKLIHNPNGIKLNDLANELDCSIPTLRTDIQTINKILSNPLHIEHKDGAGIFLVCPEGEFIFSYIKIIAKKTIVFQLIDYIFHNNLYTIPQMSNKLFTSVSSLTRIIKHINEVLKIFHISISTTPLDFIGEEEDIRFFLFCFYADFRDCFLSDSNDSNYCIYMNLLDTYNKLQQSTLHISYFRFFIWGSISKERLLHKHYVKMVNPYHDSIINNSHFINFKNNFYPSFLQAFNIVEVPLSEIVWAYITYLHCISYINRSLLMLNENPKKEYIYSHEENPDIIRKINLFLSFMFPSFVIENKIFDPLRSYLINLRLITTISPLFQKISLYVMEKMEESIHDLYQQWLQHLTTHQKELPFPIYYKKDIAITLSMLHFSILSNYDEKKHTIIFSFQGEAGYDDFLVQMTKVFITKNIKVIYLFEKPISKELIQSTKASLIVCNYDLPLLDFNSCKIVRVSYIPNILELRALRNIIIRLSGFKD